MPICTLEEVSEIERDLKKIKIPGFAKDYELFKKALPAMVDEVQYYRSHGLFQIPNLGKIGGRVFKAKKLHCESLRRNDKFRVIFQLTEDMLTILEIYFKGDKENEDRGRILKYCKIE